MVVVEVLEVIEEEVVVLLPGQQGEEEVNNFCQLIERSHLKIVTG